MPGFMIRNLAAPVTRRNWLKFAASGVTSLSLTGWLDAVASRGASDPNRRRSCIVLWMNGGPSQMDTFDLKPGHANGGPFREIATTVPGIRISEHLPRVARQMNHMALIRSMSTQEGDHSRGAYELHTGHREGGAIRYPTLGSLVVKEHGSEQAALPGFVSIASPMNGIISAGFLGPRYAPLVLGDNAYLPADAPNFQAALRVDNLTAGENVTGPQFQSRRELLQTLQDEFNSRHTAPPVQSRQVAYDRANRLMGSSAARAFDLDEEPTAIRDRYGRNLFGQGCLLARRLVERGVPFVEVGMTRLLTTAGGWDTHGQNFPNVRAMSVVLDAAWAALMEDLAARGLLDSTMIVWIGEFGRTPRINDQAGRDHYSNAWTTVLAGGGIRGGQVYGRTSTDGTTVEQGRVSAPDLIATICEGLGIDATRQHQSNVGRPIRISEGAPIRQILIS